jgi:hypothetical protein
MLGAVVALALGLFMLAPFTASAATRSEFFGIVQGPTLDDQDFQGMTAARIRTNRFVLRWGWVQPRGRYSFDWESADRFFGELAWHGIRAVPSIWGNPDWLPGSSSTPPVFGTQAEQAWRAFLRAIVVRYGPSGIFWRAGGPYRQRYGPNATPLPIQSYQIWNEPNLKKFFAPAPSTGKYARLLQISHDALRSKDPGARVVIAGMPGQGDIDAWEFLNGLYSVPGIKGRFDAAALHPYARDIDRQRTSIQRFRRAMTNHGDGATPLWISELAWGSAPPDRFGINKGLEGQKTMLRRSFRLILSHRKAWNVQRLFWFHWRDPKSVQAGTCSFCGSAGLLRYNRIPKPAHPVFLNFTAETTPPTATITSGPKDGGFTGDSTPTFAFTSSEAGSTFLCRVDAGAFKSCNSPRTLGPLADGVHTFTVRAIDAPGNVGPGASRSFTVDTQAPPTPRITDTDPNSPANDNAPEIKGVAATPSTVRLFTTTGCTGPPLTSASAARFASPGITVLVGNNTTTTFRAKARDAAGNTSPCSAPFTYVEDSTP